MSDLNAATGSSDLPSLGEAPPVGMPQAQVDTVTDVRDMIYLAAHDTAFASLTGERLAQMLTHHAGRGQVIMLRRDAWPVAFGMWARMSEDSLRKLLSKGYSGLAPSDLDSGDLVVLVGICSPWRREDFDLIFAACATKMDDGSGDGGWYLVLPPVNGMGKRLTRFRRTGKTGGVLEEAQI